MTQISNIYDYGPSSGKVPQSLVILLHGLGSNGQDLISLAPLWAQALPDTLFISPDAPFACDMVPPGYSNSYQWFSLQDRDPDKILKGVKEAAPILEAFIESQLAKHNIKPENCVLCGFSQGTMISLHVGPRYKEKLGGVLGYSGALCAPPPKDARKLPIHLVHGEADDVVPIDAYNHARGKLIGAGFKVSGHTTPNLAHSIDEKGIQSGAEFLQGSLQQKAQ